MAKYDPHLVAANVAGVYAGRFWGPTEQPVFPEADGVAAIRKDTIQFAFSYLRMFVKDDDVARHQAEALVNEMERLVVEFLLKKKESKEAIFPWQLAHALFIGVREWDKWKLIPSTVADRLIDEM